MMSNAAKSLATSLSVPHNYFDDPTKLFLDPAEFLDTSNRSFRVSLQEISFARNTDLKIISFGLSK